MVAVTTSESPRSLAVVPNEQTVEPAVMIVQPNTWAGDSHVYDLGKVEYAVRGARAKKTRVGPLAAGTSPHAAYR